MKPLSFEEFARIMSPEDMCAGSVFGALSSEAANFLLQRGKIYRLPKAEALFDRGDPSDRFYVVCQGSLDFFKYHKGEWCHVRAVNFGEETGFVPMIALHDQTGTAVAKEDSIVLEISSSLYAELQSRFAVDFGVLTFNLARELARVIDHMGESLIEEQLSRE